MDWHRKVNPVNIKDAQVILGDVAKELEKPDEPN